MDDFLPELLCLHPSDMEHLLYAGEDDLFNADTIEPRDHPAGFKIPCIQVNDEAYSPATCSKTFTSPKDGPSAAQLAHERSPPPATRDSIEERRKKISRYMKKRTRRNFGRNIKYACRKVLADSQPRVRGRFAKAKVHEMTATAP
ncbi:unnamed protein product [Spirodela intermedia]|uniref:CCT domain-containing protein n=1 Tax=Spirodela intermedia TaxID=51605 RepID=A0A7I8LJL8_SPIIN|nr:unnamed protein product [Spirodela intermedia]